MVALPTGLTWPRILPSLLAIGWLAFLAPIAALRPGELLELVTLGATGSLAWSVALRSSGAARIVALVLFLVPLVDTWPARVLQLLPDRLPVPLPALLSVASVLVALAIIAVRPRWRFLPFPIVALGMTFLLAGVVSTIAAQDQGDALGQAWLAFAVPIGLGLVVATTRPTWIAATTLLLGLVTPAIVGIAAYVLSFGVPLSGADLVTAKMELYRPHLFQELTFGNVGHMADLALLVLPVAFLAPVAWRRNAFMRFVMTILALVILIVLILVLSRSTLLVALVMLVGIAALLTIRGNWGAVTPAVGVAIITVVLLLPEVRGLYVGILPAMNAVVEPVSRSPSPGVQPSVAARPSSTPAASPAVSPVASPAVSPVASPAVSPVASPATSPAASASPITVVGSTSDTSTSDRIGALGQAITIASSHVLFGVGTGQYVLFDAAHTAPHSLLALLIVENGVLGGLGLILLLGVLFVRLMRVAWTPSIHDGALLQLAALTGASGFIVKGIFAGVPITVGTIDVWAACLWSLVAIGMTPTDPVPLTDRAMVLPVRRVAPFAMAFGVLAVVATGAFPHALEPGAADRNGVTLNSLVDAGDVSGPNDWYRATSNLKVSANRHEMALVLSQPADVQPLVLSRPIAVLPSSCYDVSVSQIMSTAPLLLALGDEEGRVLKTMSVPSGQSDDVTFRFRSADRFRVSILFIASAPITVNIGTVRINRLASCQ